MARTALETQLQLPTSFAVAPTHCFWNTRGRHGERVRQSRDSVSDLQFHRIIRFFIVSIFHFRASLFMEHEPKVYQHQVKKNNS